MGQLNIFSLNSYYADYNRALKASNWELAGYYAGCYNYILKKLGGPRRVKGESYLTFNKKAA
jgi:hypothetical protein